MKVLIIIVLNILLVSSLLAQFSSELSGSLLGQSAAEENSHSAGGSKAKYVLYSLLIPGAGQWGMGEKNRAKIFLGAEVLLWMGYLGSNAYADVIQKNYQSYAAMHAGSSSQNKGEQYWIDIGSAENLYLFNEQQLRNRNLQGIYPESELYYWQWDSRDNQGFYNSMRVQEHDWERRATFIVGAFILNRVVSAVDVIRLIRKEKKQLSGQTSALSVFYQDNQFHNECLQLNLTINW